MKINSNLINKTYGSKVQSLDSARELNKTSTIETKIKTDKIVMSQNAINAQQVSKASKAIVEELNDDYGKHRIMQLKEAIANNSYHVDIDKIAASMIDHAKSLGESNE